MCLSAGDKNTQLSRSLSLSPTTQSKWGAAAQSEEVSLNFYDATIFSSLAPHENEWLHLPVAV
jgi:hypothetical protein